jgi:SAM-dependent methyltransferase
VKHVAIAEFDDPRLAAVYESVNPYGPGEQPDLFAALAAEVGARSIIELGCGTGLVTRALAAEGYEMTGVEPSPAMLAVARTRPLADRIRWIEGGADRLPATGAADLAIMSGHVAQFFVTDASWQGALAALRRAIRPGGTLAFETRNPLAREWERWTRAHAVSDPTAGAIETWTEVRSVDAGVVGFTNHYRFVTSGEHIESRARLRFRTEDEIRASLLCAGFGVDRIIGDWDGRPATPTTRELIVVVC